MNCKFLQINLNRSRTATNLMFATSIEHKIDVVLFSEPNIHLLQNK